MFNNTGKYWKQYWYTFSSSICNNTSKPVLWPPSLHDPSLILSPVYYLPLIRGTPHGNVVSRLGPKPIGLYPDRAICPNRGKGLMTWWTNVLIYWPDLCYMGVKWQIIFYFWGFDNINNLNWFNLIIKTQFLLYLLTLTLFKQMTWCRNDLISSFQHQVICFIEWC